MVVVRKQGTEKFMHAGGKINAGETPVQALQRELEEELAIKITRDDLKYIGVVHDVPAFEKHSSLRAHLFCLELDELPQPHAEIEEVVSIPLDSEPLVDLAPLTINHGLPIARKIASGRLRCNT